MDWDRLITIEQMEEATNTLLETGKKVVIETVSRSLHHSCGSELTRQGISLP